MTPEQEEQVRRALAATARREQAPPLPPEVAARLDGVLSELVAPRLATSADRAEGRGGADELSARRRRRWPHALGVAAAVSVIAVAGAAVATGGFGRSGVPESSSAGAGATSSPPSAPEGARSPTGGSVGLPRLRTATLAQDVQRIADAGPAAPGQTDRRAAGGGPSSGPSTAARCLAPVARRGERLVQVLLDGRPASLVLTGMRKGTRAARVYPCDDPSTPIATATVRVRVR